LKKFVLYFVVLISFVIPTYNSVIDRSEMINYFTSLEKTDTIKMLFKQIYLSMDNDSIFSDESLNLTSAIFENIPDKTQIISDLKHYLYVSNNYSYLDKLIMISDCIYKIKVKSLRHIFDSTNNRNIDSYEIASTIYKKFKGNFVPTCYIENNQTYQKAEIGTCFMLEYSQNWIRDTSNWSLDMVVNFINEDGATLYPYLKQDNGKPWMEESKEYLVFANHYSIAKNNFTSMPTLLPSLACNIYPIDENGIFQFSREFGFDKDVSESILYEEILRKIDAVVNYNLGDKK